MKKKDLKVLTVGAIATVVLHLCHLQVMQLVPFKLDFERNRFIMKPEVAQAVSFGFSRLNADLAWLNFLQYYGDRRAGAEDLFAHAPDYLNLVISLDPQFLAPYWFASFVLAGDLERYDEASAILDRGIANNPNDWNLLYIAGFNQYLYAHNGKRAADYYERASKIAGAPTWLAEFAKIMKSDVGVTINHFIRSWEKLFSNSDGIVKEQARYNLQKLWSYVYYSSPTDKIKERALAQLKELDVPLLSLEDVRQRPVKTVAPAAPGAAPTPAH